MHKTLFFGIFAAAALTVGCAKSQAAEAEATEPEAREFTSPLLKALDIAGTPKAITYTAKTGNESYDYKVDFSGDNIEATTQYYETFLTINTADGKISEIKFNYYQMMVDPTYTVTKYDDNGNPLEMEITDGDVHITTPIPAKVTYSGTDDHGNYETMTITPAASDIDWWYASTPFIISRRVDYPTGDEPAEAEALPAPTEDEAKKIIEKANALDFAYFTPEFGKLIQQAQEVPCEPWEGGFENVFGYEPTLYSISSDCPCNQLNFSNFWIARNEEDKNIIEVSFDADGVTEYCGNKNCHGLFLLKNVGGEWLVDDYTTNPVWFHGSYVADGGLEPSSALKKAGLQEAVDKANKDITTGKLQRTLREYDLTEPHFMETINNYRKKYKI